MIEDILKKEYESLIKKPNEVLTIFSDFYGEDKVDLQGLPSLQEFVDSALNLNIIDFFRNDNYYMSREQSIELSRTKEEGYDCTLKNTIIKDLFYNSFILAIIKINFNSIYIYVYFPILRVTNEHDRFVEIRKLFCKIPINVRGLFLGGSLYFNKAEYTTAQLNSKYMHSHVNSISYSNMSSFQSSCLGSGPIKDTIMMLNVDYDELRWQLLCFELSKYVQVESIAGTPYIYLERISENTKKTTYTSFDFNNVYIPGILKQRYGTLLKEFTIYLINSNILKFNYFNGSYSIAASYVDFNVLITNEFIAWWNNKVNDKQSMFDFSGLLSTGLLIKATIVGSSIVIQGNSNSDTLSIIRQVESQYACIFKGQRIPIVVTSYNEEDNRILLLNPIITQSLLAKILILININYGTKYSSTIAGVETTNYRIQGSPKALLINN